MESRKASRFSRVLIFFLAISWCGVKALSGEHNGKAHEGPVVEKDQRRTLLVTEFGEITAIDVKEGPERSPYHLQFFTLEPNSLFLPVLLHADMVFYVHTGSGKLTWANNGGTSTIPLREGDLCSLREGTVFYIQSNLEAERRKLRIYAMFTNTDDSTYDPSIGAYSRINELVKGFDKKIMQAALKVPEDVIEAITDKSNTPAIVHAVPEKRNTFQELEASFLKNFVGVGSNSKKVQTYNIFDRDPDFKNHNGWSIAVTKKQLKSLKGNNIGFLMVNLNMGSLLGPHWNPKATELSVVLEGGGMVRVVCESGNDDETKCQNTRFKVKEGDAFVVPRFHAMAQMSFEDEPFVFLGFSTAAKENHPQFLAGEGSVLHILDKNILATSFGVSNGTIDRLLRSRDDSIIFGCSSCAEEEEKMMKEEKEKEEKEQEEKEKEERRKEEEEKKKKEEEEEEKKKKEKEERRKEEEEKKKKEEEDEEREQEEARRQQEKRERKHEEEEEARKEQEREVEEEVEREVEEEVEREKEEARRKRERRRREEAAKREQEKRERRRQEEEAEKEQEQAREEEEEEEQARREKEAAAEREEEQAKREQEKRERRRQEEEGEEEQAGRKHERKREKEEQREREEGEGEAEGEEEEARRQQEERERRREREGDNEHTERQVEKQSHGSSFEGRRVLKVKNL